MSKYIYQLPKILRRIDQSADNPLLPPKIPLVCSDICHVSKQSLVPSKYIGNSAGPKGEGGKLQKAKTRFLPIEINILWRRIMGKFNIFIVSIRSTALRKIDIFLVVYFTFIHFDIHNWKINHSTWFWSPPQGRTPAGASGCAAPAMS